MVVSPHYETVKARALEILENDLRSISSCETLNDVRRQDSGFIRNVCGVAICRARDELYVQLRKRGDRHRFNKGNHDMVRREITQIIKKQGKAR